MTREVLSRPEYQPAEPSLLQRAMQAVSDAIGRLFEAATGTGQGSLIGTIIVMVIVAALAFAVFWFLRRVRREPTRTITIDQAVGRDHAEWLRDAEAAEAAGRWRDALRCRYRALLAQLAAAGLVEEIAGRTTGEYVASVQHNVPAAAESFTAATRAFEVAWYGAGETTRADVETFATHARTAVAEATGRRVAAAAT